MHLSEQVRWLSDICPQPAGSMPVIADVMRREESTPTWFGRFRAQCVCRYQRPHWGKGVGDGFRSEWEPPRSAGGVSMSDPSASVVGVEHHGGLLQFEVEYLGAALAGSGRTLFGTSVGV